MIRVTVMCDNVLCEDEISVAPRPHEITRGNLYYECDQAAGSTKWIVIKNDGHSGPTTKHYCSASCKEEDEV